MIHYNRVDDVLRILFSDGVIVDSDEIKPGIIFDYDDHGCISGIEFFNASQQLSAAVLQNLSTAAPSATSGHPSASCHLDLNAIKAAVAQLNLLELLIFGSHARGNADDDSDLDLIAIVPSTSEDFGFNERIDWSRKIRSALRSAGIQLGLDILVFSPSNWQQFLASNSSFARDIQATARKIQ